MAYVTGAKHDLFISYAHVDNEPDSYNTRWVSEFVRGFAFEVRQRLGGPKDFSLFFDESDLQAYHHLQTLLENAGQSAVFVAVLSPSYVSHDWTIKELREFAGIASDTRRIIVVEKLPLESFEPYPTEIDQHKRTIFWRRNEPESYTPSTLTAQGTPAQHRQTLETLGYQVQQLLREMRRKAEQAQQQASVEQEKTRRRQAAEAEEVRARAEAARRQEEKREQEERAQAEAARWQDEAGAESARAGRGGTSASGAANRRPRTCATAHVRARLAQDGDKRHFPWAGRLGNCWRHCARAELEFSRCD